jgi:hypothetical protein
MKNTHKKQEYTRLYYRLVKTAILKTSTSSQEPNENQVTVPRCVVERFAQNLLMTNCVLR